MEEPPAQRDPETGSPPTPQSSSGLKFKQVFRSISPGLAISDGKAALRKLLDTIGSDFRLPFVFPEDSPDANSFLSGLVQDD